jgi:hypothetical protein
MTTLPDQWRQRAVDDAFSRICFPGYAKAQHVPILEHDVLQRALQSSL